MYKPGQLIYKFKSKKNRQVIIRVVRKSDLNDLLMYANSLVEDEAFVMLNQKLSRDEQIKYLNDSLQKVKHNQKIHLVVEVDNHFAGSVEARILEKRKSHVGEVGISLHRDFRDEGIGYICLSVLINEARKFGLRLLYLHCFENNDRAIHLYEKIGFKKSGVIPGMYEYKNNYIGDVTFYLPLE
jgi:RimJ/RimL family protein N-acetyltransferase